jgi:hypothetical protein
MSARDTHAKRAVSNQNHYDMAPSAASSSGCSRRAPSASMSTGTGNANTRKNHRTVLH